METRYTVNTGDGQHVYKKIYEFFSEVMREIGIDKDKPIELQFRIEDKAHCRDQDKGATDDNTHMLIYKDKLVAGVIERRTEFNYIEFIFFKNLEGIILSKK